MTKETLLAAKAGYEANIANGKDPKGFDAISLQKVLRILERDHGVTFETPRSKK